MFSCFCTQDKIINTSFYSVSTTDSSTTYYSCGKDIKDSDVAHIVEHIEETLKSNSSKWSWIMDSKDFVMGWSSRDLAYAIVELLEKHIDTLVEVRIINMNDLMSKIYNFSKSFLSERVQSIIRVC